VALDRDIYAAVGRRLQAHRKGRGLTQAELAERCGIAHSYLVKLEGGNRRAQLHTLESLAEQLGLPLTALFEDDPRAYPGAMRAADWTDVHRRAPRSVGRRAAEGHDLEDEWMEPVLEAPTSFPVALRLRRLASLFEALDPDDLEFVLALADRLARHRSSR
jgi:transcriptional regulator with XRE-family HTH domain